MSNTGTTKHLSQVREALTTASDVLVRYNPSSGTAAQCSAAALALSAHEEEDAKREEEVRELVEALDAAFNALLVSTTHRPEDRTAVLDAQAKIRAVLSKFQGEKE